MPTSYTYLRYLTYGAFIVCNAIIASIAVWGLSVAQAAQISVPTEPYLIFVGSFGLVVIFSIIFIELLRRNAITSRVWFECAWTGLFLLLELVGASLITNVSFSFCEIKDVRSVTMGCSSEIKVLEAFSWICTAILLCYFFTLVISSCINHYHNGSFIWNSNIRHFPPLENIWNLGSFRCHSPSTPILERSFTPASIIAPKPRHPASASNLMATYHSGLSQYEIEHYQPPVSPNSSPYASNQGPSSLYPQYLQSSLLSRPLAAYNPQADSPIEPSPTSVAPPPLGIWPRADILQQSSHSKRQSSRPRPVGPSGPRTRDRMASEDLRPAPLDLSKISALNRR